MSSFDERLERALNQKIEENILPILQDHLGEQTLDLGELEHCCANVQANQSLILSRILEIKKLVESLPQDDDEEEDDEQDDSSDPQDSGKRDRTTQLKEWWEKLKEDEEDLDEYSSELTREMWRRLEEQYHYFLDKAFDVTRDGLTNIKNGLSNAWRSYKLSKLKDQVDALRKKMDKEFKQLKSMMPTDYAKKSDIEGLSELITYEAVGLQTKILECCANVSSGMSDIMRGISDVIQNQSSANDKLNDLSDALSQCCSQMSEKMDSLDSKVDGITNDLSSISESLNDAIDRNYDGITTLINKIGSYP